MCFLLCMDKAIRMVHFLVDRKWEAGGERTMESWTFVVCGFKRKTNQKMHPVIVFCPQEKQLGKEGEGVAFLHVQLQEGAKGR